MLLKSVIQRKLASLIKPWLLHELELELNLGFLRSHGIAKNLRFDTSALNQLLDESTSFSFTEVRVDHLSLRVSNWSAPAFTFQVHGVHVSLAVRELEEGGGARQSRDTSLEDMKKALYEIDPEGSALHDVMERISKITCLKSWTTSLLNVILTHCCLQMHDINLLVQSNISDGSYSCSLGINEVNAESRHIKSGCLIRGFMSSLILPSRKAYFDIEIRRSKIGLKSKDHGSTVFFLTDLLCSMKLKDLQLIKFHCGVPELDISFSPTDVSIIVVFSRQSSKSSIHIRTGRQLWNIAACRIRSLISTRGWSMPKVTSIVCLWLRYIRAYENLLLLVGYPANNMIRRSAVMMSRDQIFSKSFKHQWQVISETEKELPAASIALARRVVRYRAATNFIEVKNELLNNSNFKFYQKILQILALIWNTICGVLCSMIYLLFLQKKFVSHPKMNSCEKLSEDIYTDHNFSVTMKKILITIFPESSVLSYGGGKTVSGTEISSPELLLFCLSVDAFCLIFNENVCEHRLSFSCGSLKVLCSSAEGASSANDGSYAQGHQKKRVNDSKVVVWGKPASVFDYTEAGGTGPEEARKTSVPLLGSLLQQMWSDWKKSCKRLEENEIQYSENPFILCEIKGILTDCGQMNMSCRFWKCCLAVGELDFSLGYSSILSFALLLRQMQHALCLTADSNQMEKMYVCTPTTYEDEPVAVWDINSCIGGMEMALHKMFHEKLLQAGVFMIGPRIQLSLRKDGVRDRNTSLHSSVDDLHLAFDFGDIELAISPTLSCSLASSNDAAPTCLWLKEPETADIPKSDDETYGYQGRISLSACLKFNGLNAYLDDSADLQRARVLVLSATTIQLSSVREEVHSLGATVIAFSAAVHGIATGLTVLLFIDEFSDLIEVVASLSSAISCAVNTIDSVGSAYSRKLTRQEVLHGRSESMGTSWSSVRGASLIFMSICFVINCTMEIHSMDLVLHKSRRIRNMENQVINLADFSLQKLALPDLPDHGICISVDRLLMEFSFKSKDRKVELHTNLSGLRVVIFRFGSEIMKNSNHYDLRELLLKSLECLYEVSVSNCKISLCLSFLQNKLSCRALDSSTSAGSISCMAEDFALTVDAEGSNAQPSSRGQQTGLTQKLIVPASCSWLLINVASSEIYLAGCPVKNILARAHQSNKLDLLISVGGERQTISCQCQGGLVFFETKSAVIFDQCSTSYLQCIRHLFSVALSYGENVPVAPSMDQAIVDDHSVQERQTVLEQVKGGTWEGLTIGLSQFSFALVDKDESGRLHELLFNTDVQFELEVVNLRKRFSFGLSHMSILSHVLHETADQKSSEIQISFFSSGMSNDPSSHLISNDSRLAFQDVDEPVSYDASCSSHSVTSKEPDTDISGSQVLEQSPQFYILKQLCCFIAAELSVPRDMTCPLNSNQAWVGGGSISGFDVTISLTEMQMISSAADSLSGVSPKVTTGSAKQRYMSGDQEFERNLEEIAPDGTIVAIQDVHQHMYITVEGPESKYRLVGAIHHSLAGERALFRVKYHYQRRWKSPVLYFSLTSLHARSESGEPLQLSCHPRSGFVDILSSYNSGSALWKVLPGKPESYEGDTELDSYMTAEKRTFHLVNKKNGSAIAFIDGVLEFVNKPGNPFKWKVFREFSPTRDLSLLDCSSVEAVKAHLQHASYENEENASGTTGNMPCINVTFDKLSLTIVHKLSDTKEKFPLLQASISVSEFIVQILYTKARVMTRLVFDLYYFDGQGNLWREFVHPVELCMFYRSRFESLGSEAVLHGVPVHFYTSVKKLDISITELSLDILLFVVGKLNLAGPYAVRSSVILANCCKVENKSGLILLCHFPDNQDTSVAGKQSSTMFLRHLALSQPPEASFVSIQLAEGGAITTSPIHFPLSETKAFAWRTRLVSTLDSKTYPGPFVIVETSRRAEDGLSIVVSPLLRIHNETDFSMELRFLRPQQEEAEAAEHASVVLTAGNAIDDSMAAFGAIKYTGGMKKALRSLSIGNFLFSFRPKISDEFPSFSKSPSVEWSDDVKGGKATRLSGLFGKLNYQVRKAFPAESVKCSFSTAHSSLKSEDGNVTNVHFLIQSIERDVPIIQPNSSGYVTGNKNSPVALQKQKEIFLLPTVQISNLLQSEIHVILTDKDPYMTSGNVGKQAIISCGSTVNFYAKPEAIFFTVTLTAFSSSCKPVNSGDWARKLQKQKKEVHSVDIELDFGDGKYFAFLRLSCGHRGILEAAIFTSYTLKNDTDFGLFCLAPSQTTLSRDEAEKHGAGISPELGALLAPKSTKSWFMRGNFRLGYHKQCAENNPQCIGADYQSRSNKVRLKLLEIQASESLLDLDALSGLSEIDLEVEGGSGFQYITKLGVSLQSSMGKVVVSSQIVSFSPRYVVLNESENEIVVRQCYLKDDDMEGMITVKSRQKKALQLRNGISKPRETSIFENFLRKHRNVQNDTLLFIQFQPKEGGFGWSGPVCIASLGRFFLKFRRSTDYAAQESNHRTTHENNMQEFAVIHVLEEDSTLVLHFRRPPNIDFPYRIENYLRDASITYYQKGSSEPETLGSASCVSYVWDDLTLPHKLIIQIIDVHLLREINLDKVRAWKPLFRFGQQRALGFHSSLDKRGGDQKRGGFGHFSDMKMVNLGYEVYADGLTRVLRICEFDDRRKQETVFYPGVKLTLRVSNITVQLSEQANQEIDSSGPLVYSSIIVMRLGNTNLDSMLTDQHRLNHIRVQSLSVDQKWVGAPFAAMLRRHQSEYEANNSMLRVVFILLPSSSNIKHVKYSSIILQPLDLNLDEETLMRVVPFWRTSLSDPSTPSQQYYFDHFEIHPLKIIASFLPGDSYSSYTSTQETLRSLLHSVIKVPQIKNKTVELNGVLVTHALITVRELSIKCAQHFSWYIMRAIYIAKGSPLLPPAFVSIFDDLASSSLDVFFDPSSGLVNLPGLTLGTFKLISKCIDGKGFSGTKRYFGDLGKTLKAAGSNILFAAVTEVSDSVLRGAETTGFNGMVNGFHQGLLKLAMEPSVLGSAFMEGGPDRKIKLDRNPGVDELYIEGYLQAMLDTIYKQEYLRVRVVDNQVVLKNLPPNSALIDEIVDRVKSFLVSKGLLKGGTSTSHSLRHLRGESEWRIGPTILTLCEHLFVSFAIRGLRKQAGKVMSRLKLKAGDKKAIVPGSASKQEKVKLVWKWGIGKFVLSGIVAYLDGRLCRCIPNPIARRIVSGFLLSFLDQNDDK